MMLHLSITADKGYLLTNTNHALSVAPGVELVMLPLISGCVKGDLFLVVKMLIYQLGLGIPYFFNQLFFRQLFDLIHGTECF
ncbi:hypothetical protein SAMN05518672_1011509 [Chitinophaga sp. CF118]|nr:hypothetical protein SAMN05518672_1011509 [Chitinophaga sp. CF118]